MYMKNHGRDRAVLESPCAEESISAAVSYHETTVRAFSQGDLCSLFRRELIYAEIYEEIRDIRYDDSSKKKPPIRIRRIQDITGKQDIIPRTNVV